MASRSRVRLVVAAVVALAAVAGGALAIQPEHARALALPDPASQAAPAGAVLGSTLAAITGSGDAARPAASTATTVLVRFSCQGDGTVRISVLGQQTSGQCFNSGSVEYAATLNTALKAHAGPGVVGVDAGTDVHWRVLVQATG